MTADDFKYSMERALNPDTQSDTGDVYLDDIAGVDDYITGKATEVSGIKVIDPNTLELTIKAPDAVFLEKLTYPTAFVVDKNQVKTPAASIPAGRSTRTAPVRSSWASGSWASASP